MAGYERDEMKRIMLRVQKMLRLANDAGATEGERDNAMRMAHALLAKYNLDLAQVETAGGATAAEAAAAEPRIDHTAMFGGWPWARSICQSIADLFFCYYLYQPGRTDRTCKHYFVGRTSNATTAALIAEFVVKSVYREASRYVRENYGGNDQHRSFSWGAANRIRERVRELKTDARQIEPANGTPGTALVLASVYETEAKANLAFVTQRWPKLGRGRNGKATGDYTAHGAGRAYGSTVSLNPQVR